MQVKLAIITTEFLKDFLYNSLREIRLDIDYELYFYGSFADFRHRLLSGAFRKQTGLSELLIRMMRESINYFYN